MVDPGIGEEALGDGFVANLPEVPLEIAPAHMDAFDPLLLMLDEPCAGLNRDEREDLARFILRIKAELGMAMIWIEHDMQMVADLADRIHVLDYGKTLAEGQPEYVLRDPRVVAAYVGAPS